MRTASAVLIFVFERGRKSHLNDQDQYLCHYGVKGMKWGVRRSDAELGHESSGEKEGTRRQRVGNYIKETYSQVSSAIATKRAAKAKAKREKKGPSAMTGEELTSAISRMQQEKQYRLLKEEADKANESGARKFLKNVGSKLLDRAVDSTLNALFEGKKTNAKDIDLSRTSLDDLDDDQAAALAKREENLAKIRRNHQGTITDVSSTTRQSIEKGQGEVQNWLRDHSGDSVNNSGVQTQSRFSTKFRSKKKQQGLRTADTTSETRRAQLNSESEASNRVTLSSAQERYAQKHGSEAAADARRRLDEIRTQRRSGS
jgi:hypothetical protein